MSLTSLSSVTSKAAKSLGMPGQDSIERWGKEDLDAKLNFSSSAFHEPHTPGIRKQEPQAESYTSS